MINWFLSYSNSEQIGLVAIAVSLLVGGAAAVLSFMTWRRQGHSNEVSEKTHALAEASERRAVERTDFDWRWHWQEPGQIAVYNSGRSRAFDVTIAVMVDDLGEVVLEIDEMTQNKPVFMEIPFVADLLKRDRRAEQSRRDQMYAPIAQLPQHATYVRILWTTEAGTPREESHDNMMDDLVEPN